MLRSCVFVATVALCLPAAAQENSEGAPAPGEQVTTEQTPPAETPPAPQAEPGERQESGEAQAPTEAEPAGVTPAAPAAESPGPAPVGAAGPQPAKRDVEEILITGSRIRTNPLDRPAPVLSLTGEDLQRTGLTSIGDILQRLPSSGGAANTRFNNSGNMGFSPDGGGTSAGSAEMDLRYLGSKRVLVLVDGVRWVSGTAASGIPGATDLNTIPMSLVDRIEVLQDGASSIYGSDAIGGVVNIITRKRMDGIAANAYFGGYAEEGDGPTQQYDLSWGNVSNKASTVIGLSYAKQDTVWSKDRDISDTDIAGYDQGCINGYCSTYTPRGRFGWLDETTGTEYDLTLSESASNMPTMTDYIDWSGTERWDYQPFNMMLTPSERLGVFSQVSYQLSSSVQMNAKLLFNNRKSENQAAPEPLALGTWAGTHTRSDLITIDETALGNPFGITFGPDMGWWIGRRAIEAGPRIFKQNVNTWYLSGGFNGALDVGDFPLNWDATIVYSQNRADQTKLNGINIARLQRGLGPLAECDADPDCVPVNVFGGPGSLTPEMVDYITYEQHDLSEQELWDMVANVTGELFELPAGNVGVAAGVEHRRLSGSFQPDAIVAAGDTGDVPAQPSSGDYYVSEAYLEALVPILRDMPGVDRLELSGAVRVSDYSTFGVADTYKVALRYQPLADVLLRGSFSQGFRAPTIGELYGTAGRYDADMTDPCNFPETLPPEIRDRCFSLGVPAGYEQKNSQISVTTGGNEALEAEESSSIVAGLVYSPGWFKELGIGDRLDIEINYYMIDLDNAITTDPNVYLSRCVAGDDAFCEGIERDETGEIVGFNNRLRNIGGIKTSGIDWNVGYQAPAFSFGRLRLDWTGNILLDFTEEYPGASGVVEIDRVGNELGDPMRAYPKFKTNATLSWLLTDYRASWGLRYIDSVTESCVGLSGIAGACSDPKDQDIESTNELGATVYNDVQFSWIPESWERKLAVTVGVNNVLDQDPPICQSCSLNNFDATTYDVPGRFAFVRAGYQL